MVFAVGGDPQDDDGSVTVICAPYSKEILRQVPGNVMRRCFECRCRIVASPHALKQVLAGGKLLCFRCARAEHPGPTHGAVPGALDDAAKHLGVPRSVLERSAAVMKSMPLVELDLFPDSDHDPPQEGKS